MSPLTKFRTQHPNLASLPVSEEGDSIRIGDDITVSPEGTDWVVHTPEAHAHCNSLDESLILVANILYSIGRAVQEFRGAVLARTWFEFLAYEDANRYEVRHQAIYLSPFDADEWEVRPWEKWWQMRTTRSFDPQTGVQTSTMTREADELEERSGSMLNWLNDGLGSPPAGMKWIVTGHARFVLQAPRGWRRVLGEPSAGHEDFTPAEDGLVFRAMAYFRVSESPHSVVAGAATRPKSIESVAGEEDGHWHQYAWNLHFSDGEEEMLGVINLYFLPEKEQEADKYRGQIEASLPHCLMAPPEWNCKTIV